MIDFANPYRPGEPVADPAMLFGRQNAIDWIELQLAGGARSLVISALPRIGKLSLQPYWRTPNYRSAIFISGGAGARPAAGALQPQQPPSGARSRGH
ncbi:MAG: hypothetical protein U0401_13135 [Anaerolineae bacterium]